MERVESYRYLGVHVTSNLTWTEHISQICTKARKLVGMLYRHYSKWADTDTLRCIYLTCIQPHLEYACQLWDHYINKMSQNLESIQKFACRVCLKQWDLSYNCMLQKPAFNISSEIIIWSWLLYITCSLVIHTFHLAFLYRITLIIVTAYVIRMYLDLLDLLFVPITFTHHLYLV